MNVASVTSDPSAVRNRDTVTEEAGGGVTGCTVALLVGRTLLLAEDGGVPCPAPPDGDADPQAATSMLIAAGQQAAIASVTAARLRAAGADRARSHETGDIWPSSSSGRVPRYLPSDAGTPDGPAAAVPCVQRTAMYAREMHGRDRISPIAADDSLDLHSAALALAIAE